MSKTLLNRYKNQENKQVTNSEIVPEQQQHEEEKEFIILKIYKSEIDKAIENLKRREKIYEILKQAIVSTDHTSILERDEL